MKFARQNSYVAMGVSAMMLISGCASTGGSSPTINGSNAQGQAAVGAGLGAMLGAVVGNQFGNSKAGALIGAAVGGTAGYMRGRSVDIAQAQAAAARAQAAGYKPELIVANVTDSSTGARTSEFRGYRVGLPAKSLERGKPSAIRTIQDAAALAERTDTTVAVSGPARLRNRILLSLNLPQTKVQYVPTEGANVEVVVLPARA